MTNKTLSATSADVTRVSVSLTKKHHDALTKAAKKKGVSIAWLVRQAIELYLKQTPAK